MQGLIELAQMLREGEHTVNALIERDPHLALAQARFLAQCGHERGSALVHKAVRVVEGRTRQRAKQSDQMCPEYSIADRWAQLDLMDITR